MGAGSISALDERTTKINIMLIEEIKKFSKEINSKI